jgi:hypothetical protein
MPSKAQARLWLLDEMRAASQGPRKISLSHLKHGRSPNQQEARACQSHGPGLACRAVWPMRCTSARGQATLARRLTLRHQAIRMYGHEIRRHRLPRFKL